MAKECYSCCIVKADLLFSNTFLFRPALFWNRVTIPIGPQISILCIAELHDFSTQSVFSMKQSILLLCETSKLSMLVD